MERTRVIEVIDMRPRHEARHKVIIIGSARVQVSHQLCREICLCGVVHMGWDPGRRFETIVNSQSNKNGIFFSAGITFGQSHISQVRSISMQICVTVRLRKNLRRLGKTGHMRQSHVHLQELNIANLTTPFWGTQCPCLSPFH